MEFFKKLEGKKPDGRLIFFMIRDNFFMLNLGGGMIVCGFFIIFRGRNSPSLESFFISSNLPALRAKAVIYYEC